MMVELDLCLKRTSTFPLTIQEKLLVVMRELDMGTRPATITPKEEILGVTVKDLEVGIKIPVTLPCSMLKKVFMVMGEVDIGIRKHLILTIIQVILVDNQAFIVMISKEMDIGIKPAHLIHINMVK